MSLSGQSMGTNSHSPEPWAIRMEGLPGPHVVDADRVFIAEVRTPFGPNGQTCADAPRIVECVNAMDGIPNPVQFMREIHNAIRWLGRAEATDLSGLHAYTPSLIEHLRRAVDASGTDFEMYT